MFRWPIEFSALSRGSSSGPRGATLEVSPRGAIFTLAALSHVGHPVHLALLDAYMKGQVRQTASAGIGEDSRLVLSALAAPLVAAHELGIERLTLADLILLPRAVSRDRDEPSEETGWRVRGPDSPRFLLRVPRSPHDSWVWVRAAERFEPPGCLGTPQPGLGSPWHDVFVELGARPTVDPITVEVREPTEQAGASPELVAALGMLGRARIARAGGLLWEAGELVLTELDVRPSPPAPLSRLRERGSSFPEETSLVALPLDPGSLRAELAAASTRGTSLSWSRHKEGEMPNGSPSPACGRGGAGVRGETDLTTLMAALGDSIATRTPTELTATWNGQELTVSLAPDLDGYQTFCLLPLRPDPLVTPDPAAVFETMCRAAWAAIESLMGRPLAEYRTEQIALRLIADDGRTTTLDVGASVVIVRNQTVFAEWVGSDGRVMLKLFPPGGMTPR